MTLPTDVQAWVEEWLRQDRNDDTRHEIESLAAEGAHEKLRDVLGKRMAFGTAGLRARMGAGYARMNELTILQTSQGLADYVLQHGGADAAERGVVVGYDGRHGSEHFGRVTAAAFAAAGFRVRMFRSLVPTPFVAFAVRHFHAAVGVMVTASHNPKDDNGYKVYWGNGCQIIPPHDAGIAASIEKHLEPRQDVFDAFDRLENHPNVEEDPTSEIADTYMAQIKCGIQYQVPDDRPPVPKIVYSAMHGVGYRWIKRIFTEFGLPQPIPVKEQVEPNPDFPTVQYPNPEEGKGALELSFATAENAGAQYVLANDPDADRLAMAERQEDGAWRIFTGNEIGALLADWQFRHVPADERKKTAMLCTTVSSKMIQSMAKKEGFRFEETLTGFKWIGNRALDLERDGFKVVFAFEEAIGFMVGTTVLDKDGVSAAAAATEMITHHHASGTTLSAMLGDIYATYGPHLSRNHYFICHSAETIQEIFDGIRRNGNYPTKCGNVRISNIRDLTTGFDSNQPDKKAVLPVSSNGVNLTIRTSGTEPKIKYYSEIQGTPGVSEESTRATLNSTVDAAIAEFLQPEKYHLQKPASS